MTGFGLTYIPNANFNGTDTFEYTIADADGLEATATVTVTVTPVSDAPVVTDDARKAFSGVEVILIPLDHSATFHRSILDWDNFGQSLVQSGNPQHAATDAWGTRESGRPE